MDEQELRQRALRARIAAAHRWAQTDDRCAATEPARRGLRARFERAVDPDHVLSNEERTRRAEHLMRAHMLKMSLIAARRRQQRRRR